jgi:UDP-glucuronate 4-epimerase
MAYAYTHLWGMQTVGLRLFTVYGEWGRPDMACWSFLESILHGDPIKVFNYGKNRRDFTYIDDIVRGALSALSSDRLAPYEIINLGNNRPVEVVEFIRILEELTGKAAVTEMVGPRPGDLTVTCADITAAQDKLGFQPRTSVRKGLERFVTWYGSRPDIAGVVREFRLKEGR